MRRLAALRLPNRKAFVILAVLIVVVVLSLAAYRFTDGMTSEYVVAARSSEAAQTKAFAASGVHYAMGLLADPNAMSGTLNYNPYDNQSAFAGISLGDPNGKRGGGRFSLIAVGDTYTGAGESRYAVRYGMTDESAKLNLNALMKLDPTGTVLYNALIKLPNMTEDVADAIVDWVDSDDASRSSGAESSYYAGMPTPYRAKNGPLNSIDELLLVRGVTPQLLFGNDRNRNGKLDAGEDSGSDFSRGLSEFLTVYGREVDVDFSGKPRIWLADPELDAAAMYAELNAVFGSQQELSDYVMAARLYGTAAVTPPSTGSSGSGGTSTTATQTTTTTVRTSGNTQTATVTNVTKTTTATATPSSGPTTVAGGAAELNSAVQASVNSSARLSKNVKTLMAMVNTQVTLPKPAGSPPNAPTVVVPSPLNDSTKLKAMLPLLLEYVTTRDPSTDYEMTPRINVVTAPPEVLLGLPGLIQTEVDQIVSARSGLDPTDPATTTGAFLVTAANLSSTKFTALETFVTGKTMTYRVHSVGYFGTNGPSTRIEAVIDTNMGTPRILYFRDVSDLGRGFELPR